MPSNMGVDGRKGLCFLLCMKVQSGRNGVCCDGWCLPALLHVQPELPCQLARTFSAWFQDAVVKCLFNMYRDARLALEACQANACA